MISCDNLISNNNFNEDILQTWPKGSSFGEINISDLFDQSLNEKKVDSTC